MLLALTLLVVALYFTPVGLVFFFELYARGRRTGRKWLEALGVLGLPSDWVCAAVWLRWLAPTGRTVSLRATAGANSAIAAIRRGASPSFSSAAALTLATYLNSRDPGHCALS